MAADEHEGTGQVSSIVRGVTCDLDVQQVLQRAAWLGGLGRERGALVSFRSLFLACLGGGSPDLDWMRGTARELHPTIIAAVLRDWFQPLQAETYPPAITATAVWNPGRLDAARAAVEDITPSVEQILTQASTFAGETGGASVAMRHLMVATLLAHQQDFATWQLPCRSILARYLVRLRQHSPTEAPAWRRICREHFRWLPSQSLRETLEMAQALAEQHSTPPAEITVEHLLLALLAGGRTHHERPVAHAWLMAQLDPTALAGVPFDISPSAHTPTLSEAVRDWLDSARQYALACPKDELNMRHVIAALLAPSGPEVAKAMLRRAGGHPIELARAFHELIQTHEPTEDTDTWAWLLRHDVPAQAPRRPGYANDNAAGDDLFGITNDVQALAAVLAARETHPPLSVGLFGDWGSGKSFFLDKLRTHIGLLAQQSQEAGDQTAFCKDIAQIEFNAWHYMDNDLWSSLVAHILESLEQRFRSHEAQQAQQEASQSLAFIDLQRVQLAKQEQLVAAQVRAYDQKRVATLPPGQFMPGLLQGLAEWGREYVQSRPDVQEARTRFADALGVEPDSLTVAALAQRYEDIRHWSGRVAHWWSEVKTSPHTLLLMGLGVLIPVVCTTLAVVVSQLIPSILAVVSSLGALAGLYKSMVATTTPLYEAGKHAYDTAQRAAARSKDAVLAPLLQQRQELVEQRAALDREAARLRASLEAPPLSSFREFVLARAKSQDYRERQGIIALVHRDFRDLSQRLRNESDEPKLDRIILYIDDLDRCPPARVVEVLQAIHLLLSFELFIVVVAVDSTWLLQSLQAYYAQQFPNTTPTPLDWNTRPQFYLEKIFQLPYTLLPFDPERFSRLVSGLLADSIEPSADTLGAPPTAPSPIVQAATPADDTRAVPLPTPPRAAAAPPPVVLDLQPQNLTLTPAELTYMQQLGFLVSSPRAAKHLVNLYRLVRAGLHGDALAWFVDGHYQLTQIFLAAVVGCPGLTATWFEKILDGTLTDPQGLYADLTSRMPSDRRFKIIHDLLQACADAQHWPRVVETCTTAARYSFETGRLLATRRPPTPARTP